MIKSLKFSNSGLGPVAQTEYHRSNFLTSFVCHYETKIVEVMITTVTRSLLCDRRDAKTKYLGLTWQTQRSSKMRALLGEAQIFSNPSQIWIGGPGTETSRQQSPFTTCSVHNFNIISWCNPSLYLTSYFGQI